MESDASQLPQLSRTALAHVLMSIFVVATACGAAMFSLGIGLIVLGVTAGLYGYILGKE